MEKSWLLVEWIQKDILCPSFDIVNARLEGNKQDVCVGKVSILREKYSNNMRPGKVLYISDNKQLLMKMKCMLVRMKEQMRITVEMFNNTMSQMKTEMMGDCQRVETKFTPGTANGNFDVTPKKGKTVKSTRDIDTQTAQRYSPKYVRKLRNSLKNGYEELTSIVLSLNEDGPVNCEHILEEKTTNRIITAATKKCKRDSDDDSTANAGPLKKRIRVWNELKGTDVKKDTNTDSTGTPNSSTPSMRQYINRKVLTPVDNVNNMETDKPTSKLKKLNALNISKVSAKDYLKEESLKETTIMDQVINITTVPVVIDVGQTAENKDTVKKGKTNFTAISPATEENENTDITKLDNNNTFSYCDNNDINPAMVTEQTQEDMVPIGNGNTLIPKRVYDSLNWTSYTSATRKLLQVLFSRETLSTHSLSGKQSPAFSNKPAKKQLNPLTVDDIVSTVSKKCDIKESFVRTCITIKCADEAKMLRQRTSRNRSNNEENIPCPKKL